VRAATLAGSGAILLWAFPAGAGLGYALAAASALVWATYSVLARRFRGVPVGAVAGFCAGSAVLAGATHALTEATARPSPLAWAATLALGAGPVGLAFGLWDYAMKRGDPRLLGTLAFATPVLSTLLLTVAGFAPFTATTLAAAALVAAGGWLATQGGTVA
jgi:drug/metabolite transporter (DMT)-like permease